MTLRELVTELKFAYDNSKLKAYVSDVRGATKAIRQSVNSGTAAPLKAADAQVGAVRDNLFSLKNMMMGYVGMALGGSATKVADEWASVSGRVKLATKSAEEHQYALEQIYAIAQRTNQEYTATGDLFQKVQRNAGDLGLGIDDTLHLTEIIGQTMSVGGGDTGAQQAALMQLGQALGSGALRGDELDSIIEQAPRLAQAIAESFGVPVGKLKDLGKAGKLTSKELAQGLLKQAGKIQDEFNRMPKTFGQGMTKLKNAFGRFISFAVNDVMKLGAAFYKAAEWIEENIRLVLILALSAIGSKLVLALKATNGQLLLMMKRAADAMLPFLKTAAILAGVFLIAEDIYGWTQGWESVTGDLLGSFDLWAYKFRIIKDNAALLWAGIKGLFDEVGNLIGIDISDWLPSFSSWGELASASLQWIIDGINNLIKGLRSLVKIARLALRGDFGGALSEAGNGIDLLSWKFLPLYALAFNVVKKIGKVFLWLVKSPLKVVGKVFFGIGSIIGYLIKVIGFMLSPIFAVGKAFLWVGRMIALAFAANPIGLLITVIIAAVALIIAYWDDIKVAAGVAWDRICAKCTEIWHSIQSTAAAVWHGINDTITAIWHGMKALAETVWKAITDNIQAKADFIAKLWDNITNLFQKAWEGAINAVTGFFSELIPDWVKNLFGGSANVTVTNNRHDAFPKAEQMFGAGNSNHIADNRTTHNTIYVNGAQRPEKVANEINRQSNKSSLAPKYKIGASEMVYGAAY